MAQCLTYHRNRKCSIAPAPTLSSYQAGTGDMGLVQVQVLVTAEQNLNSLTMQRGKCQLYDFNYMCYFIVVELYEKQSERGIIE